MQTRALSLLYSSIAGLLLATMPQATPAQTAPSPSHRKPEAAVGKPATPGSPSDALFSAVYDNDLENMAAALRRGADPNARTDNGSTPLIQAAQDGFVEAMRILLQHGAALEARDRDGNTALLQATDEGHIQAVRFLLDHGANIHAKNHFGSDALWLTGREDQPDADNSSAIRTLLLAQLRQEKSPNSAAAAARRELLSVYERYERAYHGRQWKTISAILAPGYAFDDWDGGSSSRREWLQILRQQRDDNPEPQFWFHVQSVKASGRSATVRVAVPYSHIWEDSWRKARGGWRLYRTKMVAYTGARRKPVQKPTPTPDHLPTPNDPSRPSGK